MTEIATTHRSDLSRYEAHVDGELAGFAHYDRDGDTVVFNHTEVDEQFAGRGVATRLAGDALADVRAQGLRVRPVCAFFATYLARHPEAQDLVEEE